MTHWRQEIQQVLLTHMANRSFRNNPGWLDRQIVRLMAAMTDLQESEDPDMQVTPYCAPAQNGLDTTHL